MTDATNNNATTETNPADAFQAFDVSALAGIIGNAQAQKDERETAAKAGTGGGAGWIPNAYPTEGNHTVRLFADPTGVMYRPFKAFTLSDPFKRIMDPRFFKQADATYMAPDGTKIDQEVIEQVWDLTKGLGWQDNARYGVLVYLQVIATDNPSDRWKAGELYCAVMNGKFEDAWLQQVAKLGANPNVAQNIADGMNPTKPGWGWDMTIVKGSQGSVTLTPTIGNDYPAVEIDSKYKPLETQYVASEYKADDMLRLFESLRAVRLEKGIDKPDETNTPAAPVAPGADGTPADTTAQSGGQAQSPTDAGNSAATNTAGTEAQAAAFFNAGAATTDAAAQATEAQSTGAVVVNGFTVGSPEACGLNAQQLQAAANAGMDNKGFAEMIGIAQ